MPEANPKPRDPIRVGLWLGLILFVAGASLFTLGIVKEIFLPRAKTSTFSVSLAPGTVRLPEFQIGRTDDYEINVECQPKLDRKRMECLLGMQEIEQLSPNPEIYTAYCKGIPDLIDMSWEVLEAEKGSQAGATKLYKGDSHEYPYVSWFAGEARRQIGHFRGEQGRRYALVVNIRRDASQLNVTDPKIAARVPPAEPTEAALWIWIQMAGGFVLGLLGAIILLFARLRKGTPSSAG